MASDMDALPKNVYDMMQRISEVYLADLGVNINEKDNEVNESIKQICCNNLPNREKRFCTMLPALSQVGQAS